MNLNLHTFRKDGGVSFIAIETIPVYREALAVMDTVMEAGLLPVWISFTLKDENHLAGGETIKEAVAAVKGHQLARQDQPLCIINYVQLMCNNSTNFK